MENSRSGVSSGVPCWPSGNVFTSVTGPASCVVWSCRPRCRPASGPTEPTYPRRIRPRPPGPRSVLASGAAAPTVSTSGAVHLQRWSSGPRVGDLLADRGSLHRHQHAVRRDQRHRPLQQSGQRSHRPGGDRVEGPRPVQLLGASPHHLDVLTRPSSRRRPRSGRWCVAAAARPASPRRSGRAMAITTPGRPAPEPTSHDRAPGWESARRPPRSSAGAGPRAEGPRVARSVRGRRPRWPAGRRTARASGSRSSAKNSLGRRGGCFT